MNNASLIKFINKITINKSGCWLWNAKSKTRHGYPLGTFDGKFQLAHRASYTHFIGDIPDGQVLRHFKCHKRNCCNPAHLKPGSPMENSQDSVKAGRMAANGDKRWAKCSKRQRFDADTVQAIKTDLQAGCSGYSLAAKYQTSEQQISAIRLGKIHKTIQPLPFVEVPAAA